MRRPELDLGAPGVLTLNGRDYAKLQHGMQELEIEEAQTLCNIRDDIDEWISRRARSTD